MWYRCFEGEGGRGGGEVGEDGKGGRGREGKMGRKGREGGREKGRKGGRGVYENTEAREINIVQYVIVCSEEKERTCCKVCM